MLTHSIPFSVDHPPDFFAGFPAAPAVFLLRGPESAAEPYVSKTTNLRRRLQRLLSPPESQSRRLNLRERVALIEYGLTGSDFEATLLLYRLLRGHFPESYQKRLRLRPAPLIRLNLENAYPRAYVTTRLGKPGGRSLYYGPFRSRAVAEKFLNDSLDLFKMRRCTFDLNPDPAFPGCVYSEMKMCLAPCFRGCTGEEYAAEVARVEAYFDSGGQSLICELEAERERLSTALDFEGAAAQHARIGKIKSILAACDEICGRLDRLDAVMIQPASPERADVARIGVESLGSPGRAGFARIEMEEPGLPDCAGVAQSGMAERAQAEAPAGGKSVALFRFHGGEIMGPVPLMVEAEGEGAGLSAEARIRAALESLGQPGPARSRSAQRFSEELAILKRWYYRSHKTGEIFFAGPDGELPMRRIVRGMGRVWRGEKAAAGNQEPELAPPAGDTSEVST